MKTENAERSSLQVKVMKVKLLVNSHIDQVNTLEVRVSRKSVFSHPMLVQ